MTTDRLAVILADYTVTGVPRQSRGLSVGELRRRRLARALAPYSARKEAPRPKAGGFRVAA